MIHAGKRLYAQTTFYAQRVDFYLNDHDELGGRLFTKEITFEPCAEGSMTHPSFSLSLAASQEFFEQMWSQGFRSAHDKGNSAALDAARREHIGDLRKAAKLER